MIKYALFPGPVVSKTDGQMHFVSANDLASLYGVGLDECICVPSEDSMSAKVAEQRAKELHLIELRPSYSGKYELQKRLFTPNEIERLRRQAKQIRKTIPGRLHTEVLDQIARERGFENWALLYKFSRERWELQGIIE